MKATLVLLGSGLLAATFAVAQDAPAAGSQDKAGAQSTQTTHSYQTSNNVIRGCLSGSAGNYTITDQNGTQYSVAGPENQLQASVGHEVELTTRQDETNQSSAQGGQTTATTTNSVQVSKLRDVAVSCSAGHSMSTPMENQASPQGTPDAAEPPQARPQTMAMLQQQSTPGSNAPQQTSPPVTSQTPATAGATTSSTQQNAREGATTSNTTSTTTSTTTTNSPQTGTTPPADQNATQASPSTTTPGSNNAAAPTSNAEQPQANSNADDQNKPLYERQATDIPWASHSNNGASTPSEQNPPH